MASYPPPYPPPGNPYGFDPRQQRRILREQARAQRDMYKAQREAYKQQSRITLLRASGLRRNSILGPLIVVALGVVLLLIRMGTLPFEQFAGWYGRWWPLLFVAAGLVLVAEWAFDQTQQTAETPYVRRGAGGGVFLLLIVLGVTGAIVHAASRHRIWMNNLHIDQDDLAEFIGDKHEREQNIDHVFPAGTSLTIDNPHGDVTVSGTSSDGLAHIVAYKQVYTQSDSDADRKAEELAPKLQFEDGRLTVTVPSRTGATVDLTVTVPEFAQTTIEASHGDVRVNGLNAALSVTSNQGDVEVNDVKGAVTAHVNHRESSFSAHNITGDVALKGKADDLNLTGITGGVSLDGDFYGDTHLEHISGATNFRTSRTSFSFARLAGTVDISPGEELTGEQIVGPTVLATRSRNISLAKLTGDVNVSNSNGSVDLGSVGQLGDVTVNDKSGSVTLTLPEGSGFAVQAETTGGEITNDFGFTSLAENNRNTVSAKVGSGQAKVFVTTTHGDVAVKKGDEAAPPDPPAMPASPAKTIKKKVGASVSF